MEDKQKIIIARIKKLMLHAESAKKLGSLEEAETFSAKVEELMIEYNIELSQIKLDKDEKEFDKWRYSESINYKDNQAGQKWRLDLISIICKHNFCDYTWNPSTKTFKIYGRMENVDVVVWLYNFLSIGLFALGVKMFNTPDIDIDYRQIYNNNRYFFLKDWLCGAVHGIDIKLKRQKESSIYSEQINGLVLYNKEALKRFLIETNPKIKIVNTNTKTVYVGPAFDSGKKAGENYVINSPLTASKKKEQLNLP